MTTWSCTCPGKCVTKGNSPRIMRAGRRSWVSPSKASVEAQKSAADYMRDVAPTTPFAGPVRLDVVFVRAIPKKAKHQPGDWCLVKVDRGNLLKLCEDALTDAGVYIDDSQVVAGNVEKVWGLVDETRITITSL